MSYHRKKCVVLGCESETPRLRSFPVAKDKKRFLKWLEACGNIQLLELSVDQLRHRVVCDKHFEERVKLATTLSRVAVPTLHLPKPIDASKYKFKDEKTIAKKVNATTTDKNSTNNKIAKTLVELSESDVGGSEDENSEEEHDLDVEQRHSDSAINDSTTEVYVGRNEITIWSKSPCTDQSATIPSKMEAVTKSSHSVAIKEYEIADKLSAFREIFDEEILEEIVACTNFSIKHHHRVSSGHSNEQETTRAEILAMIGLLYLASMKKANYMSLWELWADDGTGLEICRSAMSYKRFLFLLDCLQLDDRKTRAVRLKVDKLAPVRNIWNKFVENCKKSCLPSKSFIIGERFKNFEGNCSFIQHVSKKSAKYGLKIISLMDVKTTFICNMELYCDKQPKGPYKVCNNPTSIVQRLVKHLKGSNSNISCDERYSSYLLAIPLLANKITFLGAMGRDKRDIPLCFLPEISRPVNSTRVGFRDDAILMSHVPRRGEAVIVLSTAHHDVKFNPRTNKPMIIERYSAAKNAMDVVERMCEIYSVSKKTNRWPLAVFFALLDVAGVNAQILYASQSKFLHNYRKEFLKTLALELLKSQLQERARIRHLSIDNLIKIFKGKYDGNPQLDEQKFSKKRKIDEENLAKKKDRCFICGQCESMFTLEKCDNCSRFTYKRHIKYIKYICERCNSIKEG